MQIPGGQYTKGSFISYLVGHPSEAAPPDPGRRMLKIYTILSRTTNWRERLFKDEDVARLGEVTEIKFGPESDEEPAIDENYYVIEEDKGLLLFFTTATQEDYERTLEARLKKTRGMTQLWSEPAVFDRQWNYLLNQTGGYIYRFMSRRFSMDNPLGSLRPSYHRRFNYTGDDGTLVMQELREMYGVLPQSIYLRAAGGLRLHVTNEGLFSSSWIALEAIDFFFGMLDLMRPYVDEVRETSQGMHYEIEPTQGTTHVGPRTVDIQAGVIQLSEPQLTAESLGHLKDELTEEYNFSVIDEQLIQGSLGFSATIVDEQKGSVFNISANEAKIVLVPKYSPTFESFLRFYRAVAEVTDPDAKFLLYK